ncbi:Hypothetical protein BSSP2_I1968 [Brucella suis bv. 2]|nr:Hypothetical protein BSSP2_I1968 [Brucella suis bv. 2]
MPGCRKAARLFMSSGPEGLTPGWIAMDCAPAFPSKAQSGFV